MTALHPPIYLDSHAHVQAPQFDADREAMLGRAGAAGVGTIICPADDEVSSRAAVALAERVPNIWATIGIHPHEAAKADATLFERLKQLARSERVVAVGEIGLDYYRDLSPRAVQREIFRRGLALATELGLPVVVHSRDAVTDTYAALQEWQPATGDTLNTSGVIHCFSYDADWAMRFFELGFFISIPATVTYPKADSVRQVAMTIPEEALLVETDSPYLPPQRWRGQRNEPAYLPVTASKIAELRCVDAVGLAKTTMTNAVRLFRLNQRSASAEALKGTP